jgi:hypothetical protein
MLNNFLYVLNISFVIILILIIINIIIRIYKYIDAYISTNHHTITDLFALSIERLILFNGTGYACVDYFTFFPWQVNWRSEKVFKVMVNGILHYLNYFYPNNTLLSIMFFDFDPNTNLYVVISAGCVINYNQNISVNELYDLLKFNDVAFKNQSNYVIVVIKTI